MTISLATFDEKDHLAKIRSTGYWRVNFRPHEFNERSIATVGECEELLRNCSVRLRGWDYPPISDDSRIIGQDWVAFWCDWFGYVEYCRMYQSAQFIHYFVCREDYERNDRANTVRRVSEDSIRVLDLLSTVYTVTEIFLFASRMAAKGLFDSGINMNISLHGTENREISVSRERYLSKDYVCRIPKIEFKDDFDYGEIMGNAAGLARGATKFIFDKFGMDNFGENAWLEEQKKFLDGRI